MPKVCGISQLGLLSLITQETRYKFSDPLNEYYVSLKDNGIITFDIYQSIESKDIIPVISSQISVYCLHNFQTFQPIYATSHNHLKSPCHREYPSIASGWSTTISYFYPLKSWHEFCIWLHWSIFYRIFRLFGLQHTDRISFGEM